MQHISYSNGKKDTDIRELNKILVKFKCIESKYKLVSYGMILKV